MTVSKHLHQTLQGSDVNYNIIKHTRTANPIQAAEASHISLSQFLKSDVFCDDDRIIMAVSPVNCTVDVVRLSHALGSTLKPLSKQELYVLFNDCECGSYPPVGQSYDIQMVIDTKVRNMSDVNFEAGVHTEVIHLSGMDYQKLVQEATWLSFADENPDLETEHFQRFGSGEEKPEVSQGCLTVDCEIKKRFEQLYTVPQLPTEMAEVIHAEEGQQCVQALTQVVEENSRIAAQLLDYVGLQMGHAPQSIQQAVSESLGFDAAKQITLGVALTKPFDHHASDGPLGLKCYWRHATYSARFVKILSQQQLGFEVKPDLAYLSGLLHNIGFLLFGHLFRPEFQLLNKLIVANPDSPITTLEKHAIGMGQAKNVMGMGHGQLGAWLMKSWNMPNEIVITQKEHHNQDYRGEYWPYSALTLIANRMLKRIDIGDASTGELPVNLLQDLGLPEKTIESHFHEMMEQASALDALAIRCAA